MSNVFIAFQHNEESRPVIDAIVADNPKAVVSHPTGLARMFHQ
jgi:phenol hydroxylase P2 protein